jgi:hypothetical protein
MDRSRVIELLDRWMAEAAPDEGRRWVQEKQDEIAGGAPNRVFYTSFSAVPRHTGKADLDLSASDRKAADEARAGWRPGGWSVDQAGRSRLVLSLPSEDRDAYLSTLDRVFTHADMNESVALYQTLPLLPYPEAHRDRAAEGLRTNITAVFNAVALHNPYPAEQFDDGAWNQMVLKAVFVGSPLYAIQGIDRRANAKLARMLVDYAHERWAADRSVTPELWRPVGPFAEGVMLDDLERVITDGAPAEQKAAALALAQSPADRADTILNEHTDLRDAVQRGALTWDRLAREEMDAAEHAVEDAA